MSIITPSYNYAHYIDDCLDSVRQQGRAAHEHLVLDDGSADDSAARAASHPASPVVWSQPNAGLAVTLNRLVERVTGDWVGWLNADDFYLEGALEQLERVVEAHPDADVVIGDTLWVDADARVVRLLPCHRVTPSFTKHYGVSVGPSSMFFRAEVVKRIRFNEDTTFLMDKWLLAEAADAGFRFRYVPITFGAMRRHDVQVSVNAHGPEASAERRAFRVGFGLPTDGRGLAISRAFGRWQHRMLKVASGGYLRQLRVARTVGADARWWRGPGDRPGSRS